MPNAMDAVICATYQCAFHYSFDRYMTYTSAKTMSMSSHPKNCLIFVRTNILRLTKINASPKVMPFIALLAFPLFCFGGRLGLSIMRIFLLNRLFQSSFYGGIYARKERAFTNEHRYAQRRLFCVEEKPMRSLLSR